MLLLILSNRNIIYIIYSSPVINSNSARDFACQNCPGTKRILTGTTDDADIHLGRYLSGIDIHDSSLPLRQLKYFTSSVLLKFIQQRLVDSVASHWRHPVCWHWTRTHRRHTHPAHRRHAHSTHRRWTAHHAGRSRQGQRKQLSVHVLLRN